MIYKLIYLSLIVTNILGAPTTVLPLEKQEPTVIPIVSQSEELEPNGTYKFSYETGNGIKREETSYDKIISKAASQSASSEEGEQSNEDDNSNEIHVQRGSYSYTAPDGTVITLSYIADENGFQPVGNHLPRSPALISIFSNSIEKSNNVLKALDNSESDSVHLPVIKPLTSVPVIAPRIADKGILSESITQNTTESSTFSKSLEISSTTVANIAKQNSEGTESTISGSSESDNNSEINTTSIYGNDVSKPAEISTTSPIQFKTTREDSGTTVLNSYKPEENSDAVEPGVSHSLQLAMSSTTEPVDITTSQSIDKLEDTDIPSNMSLSFKVDSHSEPTSQNTLKETISDAEVTTTPKSLYTADNSEEKTTTIPEEVPTKAIAVAGTVEEVKNLVLMEEVTEKTVDGSTLSDSDVTSVGTEPSNEEVSTLASSA